MAFQHSLQRLRHQPPALDVFPTLQRFAAQRYSPFQPRSAKIPPGSSHSYPRKLRAKTLQNLYHDLGVMAFAGTTDHQTQKIANILGRATWRKGGLPSLEGALCGLDDKYTVYKIRSEDVVLDEDPKSPEGLVVTDELYRLGKFVGSQFCNDTITNLEDLDKSYPQLDFKLGHVTITEKQEARGLFHPTVNGPRRLPINAFVFVRPASSHLELEISFYTVGTCSYLGSVHLGLKVYTTPKKTGKVTRLRSTGLESLVKELPFWPVCLAKDLRAVTWRTWQLERHVWAKRWKNDQEEDSQEELDALTETLKESIQTMTTLKRKIKEMDEKRAEILGRKESVLKQAPERVKKGKAEKAVKKAVKKKVEAQSVQPVSNPEVVQKEELEMRVKV